MKIFSFCFLLLVSISAYAQRQPEAATSSQRIGKIINSNWTFNYFPSEAADKGYESPAYDDSKWIAVSIPHTWNTYETSGEFNPVTGTSSEPLNPYWYNGWGWYRKHFGVNQAYFDRKVFIEFDGVQENCKVWINGIYLGEHKGGYGPFDFDITPHIKKAGDNLIAVAVNNDRILTGHHSLYGGIFKDVTIILKNKLYIPMQGSASHEGGTFITTPDLNEKSGTVKIVTWVKNDNVQPKNCTLQTTIYDKDRKMVQQVRNTVDIGPDELYTFDQTTKPLKNPDLWSPEDPVLYSVVSEVFDGKALVDSYTSPLGFSIGDEKNKDLHSRISSEDTSRIIISGNVYAEKTDLTVPGTVKDKTSNSGPTGEPARIVLRASSNSIKADRASVAILHADIMDSQGKSVDGLKKALKWVVTGPAKLIGPVTYGYLENALRSTGEAGKIKVKVFASGLASGSVEIVSEAVVQDNTAISELILKNEGRTGVDRIVLKPSRLEEIPGEIKPTSDALKLSAQDREGYMKTIREFIARNNTSTDTTTIEFRTLINLFAAYLYNNNGQLIADDFNFNVRNFNICRLIAGYINATKLPQPFKDGLRVYYSNCIINEGKEKNCGDEMNWLNWIPSGGTVVFCDEVMKTSPSKGILMTSKNELKDIISLVHPAFSKFSEDARARAIEFIAKMNPYIHAEVKMQIIDGKEVTSTKLFAEKGKPILIPLYKFIAE